MAFTLSLERATLAATAMVAWIATSACGIFESEIGPPEEARVLLDGPSGANVLLVTSNDVLRTGDLNADGTLEIEFESADTLIVTLPYNAEYRIVERDGQYNFYAGAGHAEGEASSLLVRMQVLIDGDSWYDQELDLAERSHGFIYQR